MASDDLPRVLVVDDIDENLRVLSETLTHHGFHPLQAKTGERAIQIAGRAELDLVLLDIQMPGLNGFETIARLKADERTRDIPVIFISALSDVDDKVRGFRAGGVDYVSKPFREEEVIARVSAHIRLRRAMREIAAQRETADRLLRNVIPGPIADQLAATGSAPPQTFPDVTVLFSDIVDFTHHAGTLTPELLIAELNELFTTFDTIMSEEGCERIKTVGDAYLAVSGMHAADTGDAPVRLVRAAIRMRDAVAARAAERRGALPWQLRIGVHTGDVVGGIVGTQKYLFDIFGDTVNIASRMESASSPMEITVSEVTRLRIAEEIACEERPPVDVKGKGPMVVARVVGVR